MASGVWHRLIFLSDIAANNLRSTIRIIPVQHLRHIRQIDVLPPLNFGSDRNYSGGGSGVGHPRLSELCFDVDRRRNNFPHNMTLLHEVGHIIEHAYNGLASLTPEQRNIINQVPIPPGAVTNGRGEHYAIAYQTLLTGGASEAVRAALLSGRAFSGVDLVHS
jgi:hypothetical protein